MESVNSSKKVADFRVAKKRAAGWAGVLTDLPFSDQLGQKFIGVNISN